MILVGLGWLDYVATGRNACPTAPAGLWLVPVLVLLGGLGTRELLKMMASGGVRPVVWTVYAGGFLVLASPWGTWIEQCVLRSGPLPTAYCPLPTGDWVLIAFAAAVILVFIGEMRRYKQPGGVTANLAGGVFAIAYIGLLLSFAVRLRLQWGIGALASLVIVAKFADTGAYFVGRLLGRHKMSPVLSPKKTVEGAVGALLFSLAASWATFGWLVPATGAERAKEAVYGMTGLHGTAPCLLVEPAKDAAYGTPWWGWITFAVVVAVAGIVGDLAESLIKRDTGAKDSGRWLPGLGGVLDLMDSVLLAAPVAYACWALGIVGA
jgi:phosphatidate cytidylyltransferase